MLNQDPVSYTHLDVYKRQIIDRLKREFKVECNHGKPQVNDKEAIKMCIRDREVWLLEKKLR